MNIRQLTLDLARFVREAAGDNPAEVQKRNLHREKGACHSHDFCDANQCMVDAVGTVTGKHRKQSMTTKTVDSVTYQLSTELKPGSCQGCVARSYDKTDLCRALRPECAQAPSRIWAEVLPVQPKIVIQVVGGCVTYVCGNVDVEVVLCDYDTEGTEEQFDAESFGLTEIAFR
jgi:hypothetical protein